MRLMNRRSRSDGFTLVEVLVSMTVMGLIATVISSVVIVAVKNNPAVQMRTDAALTLQGVTNWLPQDVDSTPPGGFDKVATTSSGCASSPGKNLLQMQWSEDIAGTVTKFIANYRYVTSGTQNVINRITCSGTGALPLGNTVVQKVSGPLAPMPTNWQPGNLPVAVSIVPDLDDGVLVKMSVLSENNQLLSVEAAPKNPANTLPPYQSEPTVAPVTTVLATTTTVATTTTTTIPPATTTTTIVGATTTSPVATTTTSTTTTLPATTTTTMPATTTTVAPCVITSASMSVSPIKNTPSNGNGNSQTAVGVLAKPLTITVQTTGYCTGLIATPARGANPGELFRNFSRSGSTYTVLFPGFGQGSPELWADGNRMITFSSPTGGPYGSVTLQVT